MTAALECFECKENSGRSCTGKGIQDGTKITCPTGQDACYKNEAGVRYFKIFLEPTLKTKINSSAKVTKK